MICGTHHAKDVQHMLHVVLQTIHVGVEELAAGSYAFQRLVNIHLGKLYLAAHLVADSQREGLFSSKLLVCRRGHLPALTGYPSCTEGCDAAKIGPSGPCRINRRFARFCEAAHRQSGGRSDWRFQALKSVKKKNNEQSSISQRATSY